MVLALEQGGWWIAARCKGGLTHSGRAILKVNDCPPKGQRPFTAGC